MFYSFKKVGWEKSVFESFWLSKREMISGFFQTLERRENSLIV
jgi:hypothetical protein